MHDGLDALREEYASIEPILDAIAGEEQERLARMGIVPSSDELFVVYVPQLGFLLKLPLPGELGEHAEKEYEQAGLRYQFDADGSHFFKCESCVQLDERFGDISSRIKDVEAQLVRHLEDRMVEWLPLLIAAQSALAELDCLLSLATSARELQLTKPTLTEHDTGTISIRGGWHPLLSALVGAPTLVPNDCELGSSSERLMLLTGPNAAVRVQEASDLFLDGLTCLDLPGLDCTCLDWTCLDWACLEWTCLDWACLGPT